MSDIAAPITRRPERPGRAAVATAAASVARWACKLAGHAGKVLPGRVALRINPAYLAELSSNRTIALVSGTNGKTTTTAMLAAALRPHGPVASNASGANMLGGLATALLDSRAGRAALEVDEQYLPSAMREIRPAAVLLLNLSRDQLDRVGETRATAQRWRETVAGSDAAIIANADDPLVCWTAERHPRVTWVAAGRVWGPDGSICPWCIHPLDTAAGPGTAAGGWRCGHCGAARPDPHWTIAPAEPHNPASLRGPYGAALPLRPALPGAVNLGNAAMATAAAAALDVPAAQALRAACEIDEVSGRYATAHYDGRTVWLLLAKNPAGWAATLDLIADRDDPVIISINAAQADGHDTSWLYDVPFEQLGDRLVIATGARADDVGVRLGYADVPHRTVHAGIRQVLRGLPAGTITLIGDYTSFRDARTALGARLTSVPATTPGAVEDTRDHAA